MVRNDERLLLKNPSIGRISTTNNQYVPSHNLTQGYYKLTIMRENYKHETLLQMCTAHEKYMCILIKVKFENTDLCDSYSKDNFIFTEKSTDLLLSMTIR
jgi:hypothetical protein